MSDSLVMIMPMAGRGSRFAQVGERVPKPLICIAGKPFFYWATLGVIREIVDVKLLYVVLSEHVVKFQIDKKILTHFPQARIVELQEVTSGSLETVLHAAPLVDSDSAIIINDCDHVFRYSQLTRAYESLFQDTDGFLSHFVSSCPQFSYAKYSVNGLLIRTEEKSVISSQAIAGIYGFKSFRVLSEASQKYSANCPYDELFVSGVYNEMVRMGAKIRGFDLDCHMPFGTPEEYATALLRETEIKGMEV